MKTTTRSTATLVVVSTAAFLASLDLFIVNIAFPDIRRAFHTADLGSMSWILNGYTLVFAAFLMAGRSPSSPRAPRHSSPRHWQSGGRPRPPRPPRQGRVDLARRMEHDGSQGLAGEGEESDG